MSAHQAQKLKDHLIIVEYGLNGRNVATAAKAAKIPHVIIEMNPETVRREKKAGELIMYGDTTYEAVLGHSGVGLGNVLGSNISNICLVLGICALLQPVMVESKLYRQREFSEEIVCRFGSFLFFSSSP